MRAWAVGNRKSAGRSTGLLLLAAWLLLAPSGCVRRRMTIRSNPPGALVFIDDQEIGFTPVSTPFTYYGTRNIKLVRDGYETLTVKQNFKTPWYQVQPVDFVSENLLPNELRDERILDFQLVPQQIVPTEQLLERAQGLRGNVRQGTFSPTVLGAPAGGLINPAAPSGAMPGTNSGFAPSAQFDTSGLPPGTNFNVPPGGYPLP